MAPTFADPFDALFRFQRALEQRLESDWLENATSGTAEMKNGVLTLTLLKAERAKPRRIPLR